MSTLKHKGYVSGVGVRQGTHYIIFKDGTTMNMPPDKELDIEIKGV